MRRVSLFLTTLVLAALLLAACGGAQPTSTSAPSTKIPPVTVEATSTTMATEAPTEVPTEAPTEAGTTSTPGIPVTGAGAPSEAITNIIGTPVCGLKGEQLGTVKDLVLDFDQGMITYMIVEAKGKLVPVPNAFLAQPKTNGMGTGSGTGTGAGTGTMATDTPSAGGTLATNTPSAGGTGTLATDTPSAGSAVSTATSTTGTGTSSGTGSSGTSAAGQQNCMTLTVGTDVFNKVPAFDPSTLPGTGQSAADWDTNIMPYWVGGVEDMATSTPEPTNTPAPATTNSTSTPSAGGTTSATATATTAASSSATQSTPGTTQISGVILASKLIGSTITVSPQGAGAATGTGTQGTVQNVIVEPKIGKLQYLVVSLGSADTWIPVPIKLMGWDATNNQIVLMVDPTLLQNAPGFPSSQLPNTTTSGWDQQFSSYWQNGGTGSGSGTGTTSATATATP